MTIPAFSFTGRAYPVVEIGFAVPGAAQWDVSRWDAADWSGVEPAWTDASCDVIRFECEYGRNETLQRFEAGTATVVVDNASGWADPTSDTTSGLSLRPGRPIRMGVNHSTLGVCWLFRGFIDAIVPRYDPTDQDVVAFECVDALGEVGRVKAVPEPEPVGAGDSGDRRIHRLLDLVPWPQAKRSIDPTASIVTAHTLGGQVADMLGQTADSVGGVVFGDRNADICFRSASWQYWDPGVPPDGIIGNGSGVSDVVFGTSDVVWGGGAAVAGAACPTRWERPFDRADITTRAIIGRDRDTAVQVDDPDGAVRYGIEPFERTDLLTASDAELAGLADRVLTVRADSTAPRIRSVTLDAATSNESLDMQATVDPYRPSRYRCLLTLDRGVVFDDMVFATGVRHTVAADEWVTDINLDRAAPYATTGEQWDVAVWDTAVWVDAVTAELDALLHDVRKVLA